MKITILTLFPEMFDGFLTNSIIKRAIAKGLVSIELVNIRDYTKDKYHRVDSAPTGGGAGLIMKCQPLVDAIQDHKTEQTKVFLLSPRGNTFNQKTAHQFASLTDFMLICGHYEGIDERVNQYIDGMISLGDFILTGGEIASMAIADAVIRLLDGAIAEASTMEETFEQGLLEYPQYTEPYDFEGATIPDILFSGNHTAIAKWRHLQSLLLTKKYRPDLFAEYPLSKQDLKLLRENQEDDVPPWHQDAIEKGHKFIKKKKGDSNVD